MMIRRRKSNENTPEGAGSPQTGEPVFVAVGKLRRAHGVKGEMLMDVLTDFPQRLRNNKVVYVGEEHEALTLQTIRSQDRALLVSFTGFDDCDVIARLRNCNVYVKISELPPLPEGEYYFHQLMDLRVVDHTGKELGAITEILETGANDVYVVTDAEGKELLLPAIEAVILKVDLEKREMQVHPPDWS
jgi:16S rRNA processing protein RimM